MKLQVENNEFTFKYVTSSALQKWGCKLTVEAASGIDGESSALNDNAKGVDRFGYLAYAKALHLMLGRATPPICVGLFARWGSGKSFMMNLLKKEFDNTALEDPNTFEILQWFDSRYQQTQHEPEPDKLLVLPPSCAERSFSSTTLAWFLLCEDIFHDVTKACERLYYGYERLNEEAHLPLKSLISRVVPVHDIELGIANEKSSKQSYIFVDFNAWEFNKSDQLWVGLIRSIYEKAEQRLEAHRDEAGNRIDFKRLWRALKAKEEVLRSYGGVDILRQRFLLIIILMLILITCVILVIIYFSDVVRFFNNHRGGGFASLFGFVVLVIGTIAPVVQLLKKTGKESNTSRGDRIYREASEGVQDSLGFLNRVRRELDELFNFIGTTFKDETNESLVLVIFIDDLDRCVGQGRIVFVLEALQLLLNIPGAPVIAFLAVDSRIVASSIEATLNTSLNLADTPVTGWEYLDKIIQVPFCLPIPAPEKVERLLSRSLTGKDIRLPVVAKRLRDLISQLQTALSKCPRDSSPEIGFLEEDGKGYRYHKVSDFVNQDLSKAQDERGLVHQVATSYLSKYASKVAKLSESINVEEGNELLCQSVNYCLYHFRIQNVSKVTMSNAEVKNTSMPLPISEVASENIPDEVQIGEETLRPSGDLREEPDIMLHFDGIQNNITLSSLPPLVQPEVLSALQDVSLYLDPNPRKLKRIANILQLISEVAKNKPISEMTSEKLSEAPEWSLFMVKMAKWVGLSECYPFRTSLLVQILEDMDQKMAYGCRNINSRLHYIGVSDVNLEVMDLSEFYFRFASPIIHKISGFPKYNRLDSDPEVFMSYLSKPLTYLSETGIDITCADVLGPLKDAQRFRDLNFSLLSHSFNLNPAMRSVLGLEIQSVKTQVFSLELRNGEKPYGYENNDQEGVLS